MVKKEEKELTVEQKLELLMTEVDNLKTKDKEKDETISMLTQVADKARLENFDSKKKKDIGSIVKISTFGGKVVTAWRSVMDEVYKDATGVWHEKQVYEITTEDGETYTMDLVDFTRNVKKIEVRVLLRGKRLVSDEPEIYEEEFKIVTPEGKEYTLDGKFIN